MNSFSSIMWWDAVEALVKDSRFQAVLLFLVLAQWASRLPRPRKGAGNKCVFITGCDSAVGQALVKRFDKMKMHVFAGFQDLKSTSALELKDSCSNRLHIVPLDCLDENQLKEAIEYVNCNLPKNGKGLYCLINNCTLKRTVKKSFFGDQDIFIQNLSGHIQLLRSFLPILSDEGRVVTVTGYQNTMPVSIYDVTIHALEGFLSFLKYEYKQQKTHFASVEYDKNFKPITVKQWIKDQIQVMSTQRGTKHQELTKEAGYIIPYEEQERHCKRFVENVEDAMLAEEPYLRYITAPLIDRLVISLARKFQNMW